MKSCQQLTISLYDTANLNLVYYKEIALEFISQFFLGKQLWNERACKKRKEYTLKRISMDELYLMDLKDQHREKLVICTQVSTEWIQWPEHGKKGMWSPSSTMWCPNIQFREDWKQRHIYFDCSTQSTKSTTGAQSIKYHNNLCCFISTIRIQWLHKITNPQRCAKKKLWKKAYYVYAIQ